MAVTRAKTSSVAQGPSTSKTFLAGNPVILPGSYESIASASGTGSSGTITFSSIPGTYKHLQIRYIARTDFATAGADFLYSLNGNTTNSNYAYHRLGGEGSVAFAQSATSSRLVGINNGSSAGANMYAVGIMDILDYANTNKNRTIRNLVGSDRNGSGLVAMYSNLYMSTTAVSSISLITENGNWTALSSFALYGIR
jgi:hypothetical protein